MLNYLFISLSPHFVDTEKDTDTHVQNATNIIDNQIVIFHFDKKMTNWKTYPTFQIHKKKYENINLQFLQMTK